MSAPQPPFGFVLLALCAGGFGLLMAMLVAEDHQVEPMMTAALYGAFAAAGAVAFVAAEALLFARRWAFAASVAFAAAFALVVVLAATAGGQAGTAVRLLALTAVIAVPTLWYVHSRSAPLPPQVPARPGGP